MKKLLSLSVAALAVTLVGCSEATELPTDDAAGEIRAQRGGSAEPLDGPFSFTPPVFGMDAAPDGSVLVAETVFPLTEIPPEGESTTAVREITRRGVQDAVEITTVNGSPVNGLETVGRGTFFATSGGLDQGVGAGVWHVSRGGARLVGDVEAFERENDIDAFEGPGWKDQACEENPAEGFTAGPQSNPYHLARLSGGTALVADAAGNTLLSAGVGGGLDWVAVFTPPVADGVSGESSDSPEDWRVLFPLDEDTNCYVQPVPTSVDIGPDGAYYVGELTGATPANLGGEPSTGLSRVWRVEAGARHVTCPSGQCEVVLSGLTSVIDLEFGPEGNLLVLEYDENGWFGATALGDAAGGTVNRCDVEAGTCTEVESGLTLPGDITFDRHGSLWLLEDNLGSPTVYRVGLP